ncbi:hypothetical protein [Enterococcus crotali]|uniref:hypothetical protein n=1 Tax=Enterococcus crotali TaxID=1453587 RepID=UPI000A800ACF|nr:hypothetical protein [Enterococcus crotali]
MLNSEKVEVYLKKNHPDIKIDKMINNENIEKVQIWGSLYETGIKGSTFYDFKYYFEHY